MGGRGITVKVTLPTLATKYTHLALTPSIPLSQNGRGGGQKGLSGPPAPILGVGAGGKRENTKVQAFRDLCVSISPTLGEEFRERANPNPKHIPIYP
mgnify:CR=1 FL=1